MFFMTPPSDMLVLSTHLLTKRHSLIGSLQSEDLVLRYLNRVEVENVEEGSVEEEDVDDEVSGEISFESAKSIIIK